MLDLQGVLGRLFGSTRHLHECQHLGFSDTVNVIHNIFQWISCCGGLLYGVMTTADAEK